MSILILFLLTAIAVAGLLVQAIGASRGRGRETALREQLENAQQRLRQLEQELGALCSASAGAGDHVVRLEQQVRRIIERQNLLEMRAASDRPYQQASQLVHKGADIDELVDTCGLTRGEAELLVVMQRGAA
jgi:hypothetical protein